MKKKVGFFGGTFDPIHYGHLNLALSLLETRKLHKIIFSPAANSPGRALSAVASSKAREEMVALAIEPISSFSLFTGELYRTGPTYTIDTLKELQKTHPSIEWYLILGNDLVPNFGLWKEVEHLVKIAQPLVGARSFLCASNECTPKVAEALERGTTLTPLMDISSTQVRLRLKQNLFCGHLVPQNVLTYIQTHGLYR